MSRNLAIVKRPVTGVMEFWHPTTLDVLGKNEEFLEDTIADAPELLRMENRSTGIHGPYVPFRQLEFTTPQDRSIRPDIIFLAASGHVIVVEVKLYTNAELRDRRVVAQIVDYAAALTALTAEEVGQLFGAHDGSQRAWTDKVRGLFPAEHDPEELANVILAHLRTGEINMFVACDKAPAGLQEMLKGISSQASLDFSFDLVEIEPYILNDVSGIFFVPRTRLTTEVVGRTVVTVTYKQSDAKPVATVVTSSVEEIEKNLLNAQEGGSRSGRTWSDDEVRLSFQNDETPVIRDLFQFTLEQSADGMFNILGRKQYPSFGFRVRSIDEDGDEYPDMIFRYGKDDLGVRIYMTIAKKFSDPNTYGEFVDRLKQLFGGNIGWEKPEPSIPLDAMSRKVGEFKGLMLWLKGAVRH